MEYPLDFIRAAIAALAHRLMGMAERLVPMTAGSHELGRSCLIRPTAHQKVAIALHRAEWP